MTATPNGWLAIVPDHLLWPRSAAESAALEAWLLARGVRPSLWEIAAERQRRRPSPPPRARRTSSPNRMGDHR